MTLSEIQGEEPSRRKELRRQIKEKWDRQGRRGDDSRLLLWQLQAVHWCRITCQITENEAQDLLSCRPWDFFDYRDFGWKVFLTYEQSLLKLPDPVKRAEERDRRQAEFDAFDPNSGFTRSRFAALYRGRLRDLRRPEERDPNELNVPFTPDLSKGTEADEV